MNYARCCLFSLILSAVSLATWSIPTVIAGDGKPVPAEASRNDARSGAALNREAAKRRIRMQQQMPVYQSWSPAQIHIGTVNNPAADATAQDTQSETTVVDLGSGRLVAAFNDSGSFIGSSDHFTGYAYSSNNGVTWTDPGTLPDSAEGDAGDPVLAHHQASNSVYLATLGFNTGENIQVFKSTDFGHTFGAPTNGTPGYGGTGDFQDKEWIAVDNFAGTGNGNVYLCWTRFPSSGSPDLRFTRSTDGGATFGPSGGLLISGIGSGNVQGCNVVVSPNHRVSVFYFKNLGGNKIFVRHSANRGVSFGPEIQVAALNTSSINGNLNLNGGLRSNSFPQAAVNPLAARPYMYVVYNDDPDLANPADNGAIYLVRSTDGGLTWSAPKVVDNAARDQFFPAIGFVAAGERFMVTYYSRLHDPANFMFHRRARLGVLNAAGDAVLQPNVFQLGANTPIAISQDPAINPVYMGDYDQVASGAGRLTTTWSDNRNGNAFHARQPDVFSAQITIPPLRSDLAIAATASPATIPFGGTSTITLQVSALGGGARDVYLNLVEAAGLPIQSVTSPGGPCTRINGFLDCSLGSIASGTSKTVSVVVRGAATGTKNIAGRASTSSVDTIGTNNTDIATITVTPGLAITQTFSTGNIAIPLPDLATTEISLPVAVTGDVVNLVPRVRLDHTFDSDLSLFLVSPSGGTVELSSNNGGGGANYGSGSNACTSSVQTNFSDAAATSITAGVPPFAGTFRPEAPLSDLALTPVNGTWKLRVVDSVGGDSGTFGCFRLTITRIP